MRIFPQFINLDNEIYIFSSYSRWCGYVDKWQLRGLIPLFMGGDLKQAHRYRVEVVLLSKHESSEVYVDYKEER